MPFTKSEDTEYSPQKVACKRWESKQKHYSLRLPLEIWDKVERASHLSGMSINGYIITLIKKDLDIK